MKICRECKLELELSKFYKNSSKKDGFELYCKTCFNLRRLKSKKRGLVTQTYRECSKCRKKLLLSTDNFFRNKKGTNGFSSACKPCLYIVRPKIVIKLASRKWRELHREQSRKKSLVWLKQNPEYGRLITHKRRAQKKQTRTENIKPSAILELFEQFNYCCAYCLNKFNKKELTLDHFRPLSKEGTHTFDNLVPACGPCNSTKYNGLIFDWIQRF